MDADLGDVPRDIRVRRGLVRVDAVLEVRWLRLGSVELVRRIRYAWGHVRGIRVGAAAAQQIPTAIELAPNRLEPAVTRLVELPALRLGPEAVLFVHEGVDPIENGALIHAEEQS
jgi:hypothetical protein